MPSKAFLSSTTNRFGRMLMFIFITFLRALLLGVDPNETGIGDKVVVAKRIAAVA